jgi:hypothetical protein
MFAFVSAFSLSIFIIIIGLVSSLEAIGLSIVFAAWSVLIIPIVFIYAYKRTMVVVNPLRQLGFVVNRTRKDLTSWSKAFEKVRPLSVKGADSPSIVIASNYDPSRVEFFRQNHLWTSKAKVAVSHVMAMHKGAIGRGDYEIGEAALYALVQINDAYILAKGRSFFSPNIFLNTSLEVDPFINFSLEHLRRAFTHAKALQDEVYVSQLLRSFSMLSDVYRRIAYCGRDTTKYHSHLAKGYLIRSLDVIIPLEMTDVLMEGVRLLKDDAIACIQTDDWPAASANYDSILKVAVAGLVNKTLQPVCSVCVQAYSDIIFELLISRNVDVGWATKQVNSKLEGIGKLLLPKSDTPLFGDHEMILGQYFSASEYRGFCSKVRDLVNEVIEQGQENEHAAIIVRNLREWSECIPSSHRSIFLLAYTKHSSITHHLLHWVAHIVEVLMAVAWAPVVVDRDRENLFTNSAEILEIINILPETEEQSQFLSVFQWEEELFNIAVSARSRDCEVVMIRARALLVQWAFSVGRFRSGYWHFERALLGIAWLSAVDCKESCEESFSLLRSLIAKQVKLEVAPSQELLDAMADRLRERAESIPSYDYSSSSIEHAFRSLETETARKMLFFIADSIQVEPHV